MYNRWNNFSSELYHHGVKGMKWGVRRYQPYSQVPRKSGVGGTEVGIAKKNSKVSSRTEGSATAVGIVYAAYASVILGSAVANAVTPAIRKKKAKNFIDKTDKEREAAEIDKKTGLRLKSTTLPEKEDLKRVNPEYQLANTKMDMRDPLSWDPKAAAGATSNCVNCTMAFEMRQRGYEVQAKLNATGRPGMDVGASYFKGAKTHEVNKPPKYNANDQDEYIRYWNKYEEKAKRGQNREVATEAIKSIKETSGKDSRGQVCVSWNRSSGHSMAYKIDSEGNFRIYDGQSGEIYNEKKAEALLAHTCEVRFQRLDNCKVDYKKVKEGVR